MSYTIVNGWIEQVTKVPSPNFSARPEGCSVNLLVIHNISLPPGEYGGDCIEQFFCNKLDWNAHPFFVEIKGVEVSAHILVRRNGQILQFVSFCDRAWHAGLSCFEGRSECNDYSIGIELEGTDDDDYTHAQYNVLAALTATLLEEFCAMDATRIVGHSDISPGRKTDPGPSFRWEKYRQLVNSAEACQ